MPSALNRPENRNPQENLQKSPIKGFEVMRALRKGQGRAFNLTRDPIGEKRMVERAFGVGPCVMTEAIAMIEDHLAA